MKIYVDYDSSLNNLIEKWVQWINEMQGTDYKVEDVSSYDWVVDIGEKHNFNVFAYFEKSLPYTFLEGATTPISGAQEFLASLQAVFPSVTILTATHDLELVTQKNKHIEHYFGEATQIIHDSSKHNYALCEISGDRCLLMDDNPSACVEFAKSGGVALLYDNHGKYKFAQTDVKHENLYIVHSYQDALTIIQKEISKIEKKQKVSEVYASKKNIARVYQQKSFGMINNLDAQKFRQEEFIEVAMITAPQEESDTNIILNEAYSLTNSVDSNWYAETSLDYLTILPKASKGCRSTSNDDIILLNGDVYAVKSFGFEKIGSVDELILDSYPSELYNKDFILSRQQIHTLIDNTNQYFQSIGMTKESMLDIETNTLSLDALMVFAKKNKTELMEILNSSPRGELNNLNIRVNTDSMVFYKSTPNFTEDESIFIAVTKEEQERKLHFSIADEAFDERGFSDYTNDMEEVVPSTSKESSLMYTKGVLKDKKGKEYLLSKGTMDAISKKYMDEVEKIKTSVPTIGENEDKMKIFKRGIHQAKRKLKKKTKKLRP